MSKNLKQSIIILLSLGLIFAANVVIWAWTAPTQAPPAGNVAAPLNVSNVAQSKLGDLNIGSNLKYWITKYYDSFALKNNASDIKFIVGQDGHVGIGTTAPGATLDIAKKDDTYLYLGPAGDCTLSEDKKTYLRMFAMMPTDGCNRREVAQIVAGFPANANSRDDGYFSIQTVPSDDQNWKDALTIKNGNVGIGTTDPSQMLHVHSTGTWSGTRVTTAATGITLGDGVNFGYDDLNGASIWNREETPITFFTSNAEKVRIDKNGNVGIGTWQPKAKLHVRGGIRFTAGSPELTGAMVRSGKDVCPSGSYMCGLNRQNDGNWDKTQIVCCKFNP